MRPIALIRGLSFESGAGYWPAFEAGFRRKRGTAHPEMVINIGLDLKQTLAAFENRGWDGVAELALEAGQRARQAGAQALLLAGCTSQIIAPQVAAGQELPLISLLDAVGSEARENGFSTVGLLGSRLTLSHHYFRGRLKDTHGLRSLVPEPADIEIINTCLYREVVQGRVTAASRAEIARISALLSSLGAQALIPAFAGLETLLKEEGFELPLLDPVVLHARAGLEFALGD